VTGAAEVAAAFSWATATPGQRDRREVRRRRRSPRVVVKGRVVSVARRVSGTAASCRCDRSDPSDNKAIVERAASTLELAIAGIDFLSEDITVPGARWRRRAGDEAFPTCAPIHWPIPTQRDRADPAIAAAARLGRPHPDLRDHRQPGKTTRPTW